MKYIGTQREELQSEKVLEHLKLKRLRKIYEIA